MSKIRRAILSCYDKTGAVDAYTAAQAAQDAAVLFDKCFCCFAVAEREGTGRASIKFQLFSVLGLIHPGHVVLARDHPAVLNKPCAVRAHHLPGRIVSDRNQAQRLFLLARLSYRTMRAANIAPPAAHFCDHVRLGINVPLAKSAFGLGALTHQPVAASK